MHLDPALAIAIGAALVQAGSILAAMRALAKRVDRLEARGERVEGAMEKLLLIEAKRTGDEWGPESTKPFRLDPRRPLRRTKNP